MSDTDGIALCMVMLRQLANVPLCKYSRPLPHPKLHKMVNDNPELPSVIEYADELNIVFARAWQVTTAEMEKARNTIECEAEEYRAKANKEIAFLDKVMPLMNADESLEEFVKRHPEFEAELNEIAEPPAAPKPAPLKLGHRWTP